MMAMRGGGGGRRGSGQVIGKAALLIELKNRILATLHKLSDRDTQQLAVEELERIAQNLTPEGIALFLTCLYDTDAQQKSVVRRECIRLVGTLAALHGDVLACHLPKMVSNIMRRLKDPDSNIRDACVDAMGVLASQIGGVDVFVKPLLEALAEQHRNLQTGAALCLARVVECVKDVHALALQRLCPRIVKMLVSPNFLAKAALLTAVAVMVQVPGLVSTSQLAILLASVQEELDCSEWAVRKAAADTLSSMAIAAGTALGSYRGSVLAALENNRFDKVKPVRDSVSEALQLWKAAYDPNAPQESASPTRFFDGDTTPPRRNSFLMKSVNSSFSDACGRPKSMPDSRRASTRRKRPSGLGEKKANSEFFRKLEGVRDSIDWQCDVAVPRDSPLEGRSPRAEHHGNCTDTIVEAAASPPPSVCGGGETLEPISIKIQGGDAAHHVQDEAAHLHPPDENGDIACNGYQDPEPAGTLEIPATIWSDPQANEHHQNNNGECGSQWDANGSSCAEKTALDMISIHRHFHSLERQQLSIMKMLQDSMVRVHESMQDLEQRVSRLELIVTDMVHTTPVGFQYQNAPPSVDSSAEKMTVESASGESSDHQDFRRPTSVQLGEGPSARSVWHASKDEAIAAIRGAAAPSTSKPHPRRRQQQQQRRVAEGPFWMMWSRAMEGVRAGDLDLAYGEILASSDELLLVRLMDRTGPVLDQLVGGATVALLVGRVTQFLQQQSFLDCIIPWLQQASDLVSSKGPNALGLTAETKKDLVLALQEATSMDYAESWMGAKIAELAAHLGNAWS